MDIDAIEQEIIDEFALFDDWMGKYEHLIEMGKSLPLIDPKYKIEEFEIKGCQSKVWLYAELNEGRVVYTADSDAIITKGIIGLLVRVLSGQEPGAIVAANMGFIDVIGLKEHLSQTRSNGLVSMIKQMKLYALAFNARVNS
jgi:cysteine desulfuration protein SufE